MEFCPECKSLMIPTNDKLRCRKCGFEKAKTGTFISRERRRELEISVLEDKSIAMPTTKALCTECGNDTAYWWLRQIRAADESEVRFFRCTKCGRTWREYR